MTGSLESSVACRLSESPREVRNPKPDPAGRRQAEVGGGSPPPQSGLVPLRPAGRGPSDPMERGCVLWTSRSGFCHSEPVPAIPLTSPSGGPPGWDALITRRKPHKILLPSRGFWHGHFQFVCTALTAQRRRSEENVCAVGKQDDNSKPARGFGEPTVEPARICSDSWFRFVPRLPTCAAPFAAESPWLAQDQLGAEVTKLKPMAGRRLCGNSGVRTARPHALPVPLRRLGTGRPHPGRGILSRN
jgi:hypothetical protein